MRGQIIVASVASPVQVDVVFGAAHILVWSEGGIDTAARLPGRYRASAGEVADILAGTAVVVDLAESQPSSQYYLYLSL